MNTIKWLLAVLFFVGVWVEITINLGYIGAIFGWFPAIAVANLWLGFTGADNTMKEREKCLPF